MFDDWLTLCCPLVRALTAKNCQLHSRNVFKFFQINNYFRLGHISVFIPSLIEMNHYKTNRIHLKLNLKFLIPERNLFSKYKRIKGQIIFPSFNTQILKINTIISTSFPNKAITETKSCQSTKNFFFFFVSHD